MQKFENDPALKDAAFEAENLAYDLIYDMIK